MIEKKENLFCIILILFALAAAAQANMLLNPSFEDGDTFPYNWQTYGRGDFIWTSAQARTGSMAMELGGSNQYALIYQRTAAMVGTQYTVAVWAKYSSGAGNAELKIEFHNSSETKIGDEKISFTATSTWTEYSVSAVAPANTALVTAAIVGMKNGYVFFDDASIVDQSGGVHPDIEFDVSQTLHQFSGFGAQIWPYYSNPSAQQQVLSELNLKYVRIETLWEEATVQQLQDTYAQTSGLGVEWLTMIWIAPYEFTSGGMLLDDKVDDFALWWANHVAMLDGYGCRPAYIEFMNEPDSGGSWSTGISPTNFNTLTKLARQELDSAGYTDVGIVGPGLTHLDWDDHNEQWISALDSTAVASLAAWSTHAWDDGDLCGDDYTGGASCLTVQWPGYADPADAKDPTKPKWLTEIATKENVFHGVTYPRPDTSGLYNAANTMPYAVRFYENTLANLNCGASVGFIWQAIDEPTEVYNKDKGWGLLDLNGDPKPVFNTLKTLCPKIPIGASIVSAPDQLSNPLYAGTYLSGSRVIVGISNDSTAEQTATVRLQNAGTGLGVVEAVACEQTYWGDPDLEIPDQCQIVSRSVTLNDEGSGTYNFEVTLPADSTLTVVMDSANDSDPPTPDPMTWATVPYATGSSSIRMVATTATDPSGVEYYFTCTAGGGNDSGWQDDPDYEDTGLSPETSYTYTVKARDKSVNHNETAPSSAESAVTDPPTPEPDMYVNDITMSWRRGGSKYYGQATIWVKDDTGANVDGATVYGNWSGAVNEPDSGITLTDGTVLIESSGVKSGGTFTFTVTDIVKTGYIYNPSLNVETYDSVTAP